MQVRFTILFLLLFAFAGRYARAEKLIHTKGSFAEWLYHQKDYYRAMTEFQRKMVETQNKEQKTYLGLRSVECAFLLTDFRLVIRDAPNVQKENPYYEQLQWLKALAAYRMEKLNQAKNFLTSLNTSPWVKYQLAIWHNIEVPNKLVLPVVPKQKLPPYLTYYKLYQPNEKIALQQKTPWVYAGLSMLLPGLGQMALGEFGDGISSLFVTGGLAFLSVLSFQSQETALGVGLATLSGLFYAGSVYGAYAEASRQNYMEKEAYREKWASFMLRYKFP
ncbi:MAG: hypothetical protein D6767_07570 [Candidatus Hydrogenedentota bacterium]|nr:MAG: hypothetical protein D6767_07570 [Candidatus Hydrogenedentota bacterium]